MSESANVVPGPPDPSPGLLAGLRVVSFCHYLQGPAASQYLADLGADVVKIEPLDGAHERRWSGARSFVGGISSFYLAGNRNKRSLAISLKTQRGLEIVKELIQKADALIENFRPGVMDRLGLGFNDVEQLNPKIIYASATGFGPDGPLAGSPGQDLLIQARCGLVAASGGHSIGHTPVGAAVVDQHGAALLAFGVLAAYVRRLRDGKATRVESNLFNAGLDLQAEAITAYLAVNQGRKLLARDANLATWFHEAPYGIYRTRDRSVAISINDLRVLAQALGSDALLRLVDDGCDPFADRNAYAAIIASELASWSFAKLANCFEAAGIWYAPVQDYEDLMNDPQLRHNELLEDVSVNGQTVRVPRHPVRYDGQLPPIERFAFRPGAHTREVLQELGYGAEDVRRLEEQGVVRCASERQETDHD
jgi:crotonobetainyl-CoA:carnitine CoA-transferase CaiB-like acyl-CoA transferase